MPFLDADDGVRLWYRESGSPDGRPVVLIAGFRAAATSWRFQVPALERAGHRVLAFDRRGHGESEAGASGHTMAQHGADLARLLDELDLREAVLVGGSMGGNTIWSSVGQGAAARTAGIVIVDQTPKMLNTPDWPHGFYGYDASTLGTYFVTGVPETGEHPMTQKGLVRIVRLMRAMDVLRGLGTRRELTPGELELLQDHARADWRDAVAATTVPVLFVAGAESEFWPATHAAAAAALAPIGLPTVLERAGHPANIEQPAAFDAALAAFIAELPPRFEGAAAG